MPLRLYADECVNARIVAGLRRRGVDVVTAADNGLLSASDELHVERALALGRAVVTSDRDFLVIVSAILVRGESFPGLIFIQPRSTLGDAVRRIAENCKGPRSSRHSERDRVDTLSKFFVTTADLRTHRCQSGAAMIPFLCESGMTMTH